MKRHTQTVGVRRWAGDDLVELQSEPMKVLDAFFAEHGPCIIEGCAVAAAGDNSYNVAAGLVALEAEDADGVRRVMAMPFAGVSGTALPVYLVPEAETVTDVYDDGKVHPIAYDYRATATAVKPSEGSFLTIDTKGGVRFTDAVQDGTHRFITDAERTDWNKKETPAGAQEKADAALTAAKQYADTTEDNAVRDAVLGTRWTGAIVGGNKGGFKSQSPALILPDQPTTLIVCFRLPKSDTAIVYDVNTTSANVTSYGEYIFVQQGNFVRVSMRGAAGSTKSITGTDLCMAALSYTPNQPLLTRINESVEVSAGVPEYKNPYTPQHVRLGGWSSSYTEMQIISVRRFDFAMTEEQLAEAWNGGHPELWSVPDKYRNGAEGARCFLDLNPASLTSAVWYDQSGQGNDIPYVTYAGQPAEATLVTDTTAIASLTDVEREALLAYARRYDADRAAVLLRQADLTATAELEEHAGDAVAHITSEERSAWNKKETPAGAQEKADAAEETAVRDAVLGTRISGVEAGNGKFYYAQQDVAFEGERTVRVVFRTGEDIQNPQCICVDGTSNVTSQITVTNGSIIVRAAGSGYTFKGVKPNTIYEAVAVTKAEGGRVYLNGEGQDVAEGTHVKPVLFLIGSNHNDDYVFTGTVLASQLFNFAFSDEDAAASWNGGHPELWHVPDVLRYKSPTVWPTATYKSGSTFIRNGDSIVETDNIPSANGFSKDYQRFEQNPAAYCAFLNESRLNTKPFRWKFTIEYRADSSVTVEMKGGYSRPALTLDANTGDAKTVQFVTDAGYGVALRTRGGGTYLEVATISVESANIVCNLIPASLTPTVWYDLSGRHNDVPYVPFEGKPAEAALSCSTEGFAATTDADREALLAYACQYDADREAVLLRQADLTATAELEEHAGDGVVHITSEERSAWNEKESPDGAQAKADAAEETAVRDVLLGVRAAGAEMGKGYFRCMNPTLGRFGLDMTIRLVFKTGEEVNGSQILLNVCEEANEQSSVLRVALGSGRIQVMGVGGVLLLGVPEPNTLYEAVVVCSGNRYIGWLNNQQVTGTYTYKAVESVAVDIGGSALMRGGAFRGRMIAVQIFNIPFDNLQAQASWNDGHPELWCVPDAWQYQRDDTWPDGSFPPTADVWTQYPELAEYSGGCMLDLMPASLTPTEWFDCSGFHHSVPYRPFEENPAKVSIAYDRTGLPVLTADNREMLLVYAAHYAAVREAVMGWLADEQATVRVDELSAKAVQSATIGGKAVTKSGTTLQLPAYPTVPQMDGMQGTSPSISVKGTTIYHAVFGNMLFVTGGFVGADSATRTGMSIPIPGFDRMMMGAPFQGAIIVYWNEKTVANVYLTTISPTTVNGSFGLQIDWGLGLILSNVQVVLMPILIPLASLPPQA